jgi:hypothetical protein
MKPPSQTAGDHQFGTVGGHANTRTLEKSKHTDAHEADADRYAGDAQEHAANTAEQEHASARQQHQTRQH